MTATNRRRSARPSVCSGESVQPPGASNHHSAVRRRLSLPCRGCPPILPPPILPPQLPQRRRQQLQLQQQQQRQRRQPTRSEVKYRRQTNGDGSSVDDGASTSSLPPTATRIRTQEASQRRGRPVDRSDCGGQRFSRNSTIQATGRTASSSRANSAAVVVSHPAPPWTGAAPRLHRLCRSGCRRRTTLRDLTTETAGTVVLVGRTTSRRAY
jgi:hypothetical protein